MSANASQGVYVVLKQDGQVLFMHRISGYLSGADMLPGGGVEEGESPTEASVREAREELGIEINSKDFKLIHIMFRGPHDDTGSRIDYFFEVKVWTGEPENKESQKCDELRWHDLNELPQSVPQYVRVALKKAQEKIMYSEFDWKN